MIHQEPERAWTLEGLGHIAEMSRAKFAAHFRATMGQTPFEYLASWRIGVAQSLLKKGQSLKMVTPLVGYGSAGALSKAFFSMWGQLLSTGWLPTKPER